MKVRKEHLETNRKGDECKGSRGRVKNGELRGKRRGWMREEHMERERERERDRP